MEKLEVHLLFLTVSNQMGLCTFWVVQITILKAEKVKYHRSADHFFYEKWTAVIITLHMGCLVFGDLFIKGKHWSRLECLILQIQLTLCK
jgi:hypothetical protein